MKLTNVQQAFITLYKALYFPNNHQNVLNSNDLPLRALRAYIKENKMELALETSDGWYLIRMYRKRDVLKHEVLPLKIARALSVLRMAFPNSAPFSARFPLAA